MVTVREDRVKDRLTALAAIGEGGGITRLSYTPEYRQATELVQEFMQQAGMSVTVDAIGNLIGCYRGTSPELPAVLAGSHLDTVPGGGAFDGAVGVIGAIECVQAWHDAGFVPRRNVEVIATVEEEGTQYGLLLGSMAIAGLLNDIDPEQKSSPDGRSLAAALRGFGLDPAAIRQAARDPRSISCFLELHIEQGSNLDEEGLACGIVSEIVGIDRRRVTIKGSANHSGTTRMDQRRDALVAAACFIESVYKKAGSANGRYVATVGTLAVYPNAVNIVPGEVELSFEIRFIDSRDFDAAYAHALDCLREIEREFGVTASVVPMQYAAPIKLDAGLGELLDDAACDLGIPHRGIPSWAGHDAQIFAKLVPTAMLFVPSVRGISHSPQELTRWQDIIAGVKVLETVLRKLAQA